MKVICNSITKDCPLECPHICIHEEFKNCTEFFRCSENIVKCSPPNTSGAFIKYKKVIDYKILDNFRKDDLKDAIINSIENGWELQGGSSGFFDSKDNKHFCQAMVKYE